MGLLFSGTTEGENFVTRVLKRRKRIVKEEKKGLFLGLWINGTLQHTSKTVHWVGTEGEKTKLDLEETGKVINIKRKYQ